MDLLLIDDHRLVRDGIRAIVEATGLFTRTIECGSLASALARVDSDGDQIGFVILDLGLPDASGFECLIRVRDALPGVPILVVSGEDQRESIDSAFDLGARGYLPKSSSPTALRLAIESILGDELYVPPQRLGHLGRASQNDEGSPPPPERGLLTRRQCEVLRLLAKGRTNKEIAEIMGLSLSTIRIHVSAVLDRLGVENRTQAATCPAARRFLGGGPT
ncbi:MAG: response regulator transcription factor [Myxococcales bacterium]